ncbi:MAG: hypothetical protein K2K70_05845 [Lachnospiraceae bacterium]|nr:hypothetical protein [Lachnospiraceae bacterium]
MERYGINILTLLFYDKDFGDKPFLALREYKNPHVRKVANFSFIRYNNSKLYAGVAAVITGIIEG